MAKRKHHDCLAALKDFRGWLQELSRFGTLDDHAVIAEGGQGGDGASEHFIRVELYTDTNRYAIRAVARTSGKHYLGCTAMSRKPRAGEDWHRGRDLHDGPLTRETWHSILADIVSFEMVRVHRPATGHIHVAAFQPLQPEPPGVQAA